MGIYLGPFRLTKRGIRVRIGPRAARLHLGAGIPLGVSAGAGPVTWYRVLTPPGHSLTPRTFGS